MKMPWAWSPNPRTEGILWNLLGAAMVAASGRQGLGAGKRVVVVYRIQERYWSG